MVTRSSATPLVTLDSVVLDTETTGPDPTSARLIQIGAVRISGGRIKRDDTYETLVNPGIPIPPSSTEIHHIHDSDVAGAPDYASVDKALGAFLEDAIVIGHSIGFDLAILKREADRAGLPWRRPRTLDTRLLARIVQPMLNDFSLDTLAGWLGVEIEDRHTALGDAVATAKVFQALLPHLREKHIRTLAEAEAASRGLTEEAMQFHAAGWEDAVAGPQAAPDRTLARIDSYPYRHRIRDVMSAPPVSVEAGTTLKQITDLLIDKKISSVFVDDPKQGLGIVTERDVLRSLAAKGADALNQTAGSVMSHPLATVRADAFIYRAIARMDRLNLRHLAVVDDRDRVVGALTSRNLLHQRASSALVLNDEIDFASNESELAVAWARLPAMAEQLVGEEVDPLDIAAVISREICAITRRASELSVQRMEDAGKGAAPAPYAVMVLGSGGRGESLLAADQDNAIVYDAASEDGTEDAWFAEMATHLAEILDSVGIPFCQGGVMAKNRTWRHTVEGWKREIDGWVRRSNPADLLNVDIFYDLAGVFGDAGLVAEIHDYAYEQGSKAPDFAKLLAETTADFKPPLGLFGGLKAENGRIDLKRGGLLPIVTAARVLSIRHQVVKRETPARLNGIRALGIGSDSDFDHLVAAHQLIVGHILRQQIRDIHAGEKLSNKVEVKRLDKDHLDELKTALGHLAHTDRMVEDLLFAKPAGRPGA